jgi:hypothetical protein
LGGRSLADHVGAVATPLVAGELDEARRALGWMVSRETAALGAEEVARATVETTLENGNDAVFGALFWAALLGGPGALAFRLANTLDAMWGYKDERRIYFGWCAARADDVLGLIPARLTALTYALLGRGGDALACWRAQAPAWSSPNAGPVMAAGAGALGVSLGGAAVYHGRVEQRPLLGAARRRMPKTSSAPWPWCGAVRWPGPRWPGRLALGERPCLSTAGACARRRSTGAFPLAEWVDLSTGIAPWSYPVAHSCEPPGSACRKMATSSKRRRPPTMAIPRRCPCPAARPRSSGCRACCRPAGSRC